MKKLCASAGLLIAVIASSCSSEAPAIGEAETCGELVDAAFEATVDYRDSSVSLTSQDFVLLSADAEQVMEIFRSQVETADARASEFGCDLGELRGDYLARVFELPVDSEGGLVALDHAINLGPFRR